MKMINEDEPGWDCLTMGNGICGPLSDKPGASPSTYPDALWLTPAPYMIGMVCLWIIGAVVLALAPGAKRQVGKGLWWVALFWPVTIPLGVMLAYIEWARRTRMGSAQSLTAVAPDPTKWGVC
jgi:ABC-type sugar transport system permease subunit